MRWNLGFLEALLSLSTLATADPTWPSKYDELEEIMYQVQGFRNRQFGGTVIPCSSQASGPGRHNAAEWIRAAFHDMATTTIAGGSRNGGLDGSLQYELTSSDNLGPGFNTTLKFMADYYTSRSSIADLLALGVYYAVRSCGGPVVPFNAGRIDATAGGPLGVPLPQNTAFTFEQQFLRMGFDRTEMIQVTACGHTLGSVHASEFPQIVPVGSTANGAADMDSTVATFDNKIVTEYIAGNTTDPLVVGPSIRATRNSDFKVFNYDQNVTVKAMADPTKFSSVCTVVLQKMINVVPDGVVLSDPVQPYVVKPVNIQLSLNAGASTMQLTGYIRVRITDLGSDTISSVVLTYRDRKGGSDCGNAGCTFTAIMQGATQGFDDQFRWFPINALVPTSTGISSFTLTLNMASGPKLFNNNGNSYPVQDAILLQQPQSCIRGGILNATAAIRNDRNAQPVNMYVSYKTPNSDPNRPVPTLQNTTVAMIKGACVGPYTFYTASFSGLGDLGYASKIDVISGSGTSALRDDFNAASDLGGTCQSFSSPPASLCTTPGSGPPPNSSSTTTVSTSSSTMTTPSSSTTSSKSTSSITSSSMTSSTSSSATSSTTSSSAKPVETLHHRETLGEYKLVGCKAESTSGRRALSDKSFAYDGMTLESCMKNCTGYNYWGTEYGRECYCGNSIDPTSQDAAITECRMVCSGDASQYCGAGNRIELYVTTGNIPTPTATLAPKATVSPYVRIGCYSEVPGRALRGASHADVAMTLEMCASSCAGFKYWAAEYGRECYCGNALDPLSQKAAEADCNMVCAGDRHEYCGAGNRLELYQLATVSVTSAASTPQTRMVDSTTSGSVGAPGTTSGPSSSTRSATTTMLSSSSSSVIPSSLHRPTVSAYSLVGCWTEATGVRALSARGTRSPDMTLEACADFCQEYHYFGTEYGGECYCGNVPDSSSEEAPLSDCDMACTGDSAQYCGGRSRLELYYTNTTNGPSQPVVIPGRDQYNWSWSGCQTEPKTGGRALTAKTFATDDMALGVCAEACSGYAYFGTEYGRECYCGDSFNSGSTEVDATECSMACAGNRKELCGAGGRLSVYERTDPSPS